MLTGYSRTEYVQHTLKNTTGSSGNAPHAERKDRAPAFMQVLLNKECNSNPTDCPLPSVKETQQ